MTEEVEVTGNGVVGEVISTEPVPSLDERVAELTAIIDGNIKEFKEAMAEVSFLAQKYGEGAQLAESKDHVYLFQRLFERADAALNALK